MPVKRLVRVRMEVLAYWTQPQTNSAVNVQIIMIQAPIALLLVSSPTVHSIAVRVLTKDTY